MCLCVSRSIISPVHGSSSKCHNMYWSVNWNFTRLSVCKDFRSTIVPELLGARIFRHMVSFFKESMYINLDLSRLQFQQMAVVRKMGVAPKFVAIKAVTFLAAKEGFEYLSTSDKKALRASWHVIEGELDEVAIRIFHMIFEQCPEAKSMFRFPQSDYVCEPRAKSKEFRFHALRFMQVQSARSSFATVSNFILSHTVDQCYQPLINNAMYK